MRNGMNAGLAAVGCALAVGCAAPVSTAESVGSSEQAVRDPDTGEAPELGPGEVKDVWLHTNELYALQPFTRDGLAIESYTVETGPWFTDAYGPQSELFGTFFAAPDLHVVKTVYPMRDTGIDVRFRVMVRGTSQREWTDHVSVIYKIVDTATMNPRWIVACRFLENAPGKIFANNANEVVCMAPIDVSGGGGSGEDEFEP